MRFILINRLIERNLTNDQLHLPQFDVLNPKNQYGLYKDAFRSDDSVNPSDYIVSGSTHLRNFNEVEHTPEEIKKYKQMSISDLELVQKGTTASEQVSEGEAFASLKGAEGHFITMLMYEHLRAVLSEKPLDWATTHLPGISPKSDSFPFIYDAFYEAAAKRETIRIVDIPQFIADAWKGIKAQQIYRYATHRRRVVEEGTQYNAAWVYDATHSWEMQKFEDTLFYIFERKIREKMETPFFEGDEYLFFPLETSQDLHQITEQPFWKLVDFGDFRIQFLGRADYVLDRLCIDEKFGRSDELYSAVNRVQALLYSNRYQNWTPYTDIVPNDRFYYNWFDTRSHTPQSYYIDATVYPDEIDEIHHTLYSLSRVWSENIAHFKAIKKAREEAIVIPFLADPN